jgi:hypothetical protein
MIIVDLFCGLGGWSAAFKERGHDVFTLDKSKRFSPTIFKDILDIKVSDLPSNPDIILASPPCEGFSRLRYAFNWEVDEVGNSKPISVKSRLGIKILQKTVSLIKEARPRYFIIENPVGKMRSLDEVADLERRTVTYCQYGSDAQKPTDLWGGFPPGLILRPPCKAGSPCHISAAGSAKGAIVTASDAAHRAVIPYALSLDVCLALEASPRQSEKS